MDKEAQAPLLNLLPLWPQACDDIATAKTCTEKVTFLNSYSHACHWYEFIRRVQQRQS